MIEHSEDMTYEQSQAVAWDCFFVDRIMYLHLVILRLSNRPSTEIVNVILQKKIIRSNV